MDAAIIAVLVIMGLLVALFVAALAYKTFFDTEDYVEAKEAEEPAADAPGAGAVPGAVP